MLQLAIFSSGMYKHMTEMSSRSGWPNDIHVEQFDDAATHSTKVTPLDASKRPGKKGLSANSLSKLVFGRSQQHYAIGKPSCHTNRPFTKKERWCYLLDTRANNARMTTKNF